MKIYNSLTKKKEEFIPIEKDSVKMYACGITVYDDSHIGHARASITYDMINSAGGKMEGRLKRKENDHERMEPGLQNQGGRINQRAGRGEHCAQVQKDCA